MTGVHATRRASGVPARVAGLAGAVLALWLAPPAHAGDGSTGTAPYNEYVTYYEQMTQYLTSEDLEALTPRVPTSLYFTDTGERVRYARSEVDGSTAEWQVEMDPLYRSHEKVDAVYSMLVILPLPEVDGVPAWEAGAEGMTAWQGSAAAPTPFVYAGEEIVLKRDAALELKLIPALLGASGEAEKLPSLEGSGYAYTVWTTRVKYDWSYGDRLGGWVSLRYRTAGAVEAPDASDERFKVYLVTWIPALGDVIPPYAVRLDVAPGP